MVITSASIFMIEWMNGDHISIDIYNSQHTLYSQYQILQKKHLLKNAKLKSLQKRRFDNSFNYIIITISKTEWSKEDKLVHPWATSAISVPISIKQTFVLEQIQFENDFF